MELKLTSNTIGEEQKHNKLFKQIRHAWHFWFAVILVFTE